MKDRYGALCPPFVYSKQIECGPSRDAVVVSKRHGACELMLANLLTQQASTLHTPQSTVLQCRIVARKGKQPEGESAAGGHAFCVQRPRPRPGRVFPACVTATAEPNPLAERLVLDICLHGDSSYVWC